jgi:uncharacterized membrane protein
MTDDRTFGERIADQVAQFGGSWKFIIIFSSFLLVWIIFNVVFEDTWAFDKSPFILLNLILSFIAAFQAPFIMMSQNRAEKKTDEAYRHLFGELKELVESDIQEERHIQKVTDQICQIMEEMRADHKAMKERLDKLP